MLRLAAVIGTLFLAMAASAAPMPIGLGPDQPQAYAWQPGDSWPGEVFADSRLDQPVRFWRAALTVPEVFAGIQEQTGVEILTWPPQDPLARMRVNLYLSKDRPPTLREVMAQLSWVTRCGFACTEGPERRYYLLGTGEVTSLEAQWAAAQHQREVAARRHLLSQLERYRTALGLSQEEAVARYRGKDDMLLLTLLDPDQRARLRVLCSLSPQQLATLVEQGELTLTLSDRDLAQRGGLPDGDEDTEWQASFRMPGGEGGRGMGGMRGGSGGTGIQASFATTRLGRSFLEKLGWPPGMGPMGGGGWPPRPAPRRGGRWGPPGEQGETGGSGGEGFVPQFPVVADSDGSPEVELEARRLLGEIFTEESEREFRNQAYDRWERESRARRERDQREAMRAWGQLSEEVARRLGQVTMELRPGAGVPMAIWQVQEAVAEATGLSVISDCFTAEYRQFADPLLLVPQSQERMQAWREEVRKFAREHPGEWHQILEAGEYAKRFPGPTFEMPVGDWLTSFCYPGVQTDWGGGSLPQDAEGWEWGDAGPFLRFRTPYPEIWRGAMPPEPVERVIEEAIEPYLWKAAEGKLPKEVPFPLDIRTQAWIVSRLGPMQMQVASALAYDDPSTAAGQLHNGLMTQIMMHLSAVEGVLRFLGTLREDQWEALHESGLNAWDDLTAEQRSSRFIAGWALTGEEPAESAVVWRQVHLRLLTMPGKNQLRLEVRGPEDRSVPQAGTVEVEGSDGGDMHRSMEDGETFFSFSAPLQTEVILLPPVMLSRKE